MLINGFLLKVSILKVEPRIIDSTGFNYFSAPLTRIPSNHMADERWWLVVIVLRCNPLVHVHIFYRFEFLVMPLVHACIKNDTEVLLR